MPQTELPMPVRELPASFVERWRALGGEPLAVDECIEHRGRWWIIVRIEGRSHKWAVLHRDDCSKAADDLFAMTRK